MYQNGTHCVHFRHLNNGILISIKVFGRGVKIQLRIWLYLHNNGTDKTECLLVYVAKIRSRMNIPEEVKELAKRKNKTPVFVGIVDGAQVYRTAPSFDVPPDQPYPPTGLPSYIVFKDGKATNVYGLDALDLLGRLTDEE